MSILKYDSETKPSMYHSGAQFDLQSAHRQHHIFCHLSKFQVVSLSHAWRLLSFANSIVCICGLGPLPKLRGNIVKDDL